MIVTLSAREMTLTNEVHVSHGYHTTSTVVSDSESFQLEVRNVETTLHVA